MRSGSVQTEAYDNGQTELEGLGPHPRMPAEVIIVTGERTALDSLLKPITGSLSQVNRALQEESAEVW